MKRLRRGKKQFEERKNSLGIEIVRRDDDWLVFSDKLTRDKIERLEDEDFFFWEDLYVYPTGEGWYTIIDGRSHYVYFGKLPTAKFERADEYAEEEILKDYGFLEESKEFNRKRKSIQKLAHKILESYLRNLKRKR